MIGAGSMNLDMRWIRLRAVWLLVIPFLWFARPTWPLLAAGSLMAAAGLAVRGWAAGVIVKERELTTHGPYAYTRNPLYVGSFLLGLGVTVAGGRWIFVVLFLLFFAVVYRRTMRGEEALLEELFGERYRQYSAAVPRLLPRPTPYREGRAHAGFSLERYRRNREWEALLGTAAGFAFLVVKLTLS